MTSWFQPATKGPGLQGDQPVKPRNTLVALKQVADDIEALNTPTGTREAPGITCRDIALADPTLKNGYYWINPNGGSISDAIKVFCKMKGGKTQTCLEATTQEYATQRWQFTKMEEGTWMFAGSFSDREMFYYGSHKSQIKMLQHHADNARQRVVMSCNNVIAVHDKATNSYDRAITLTSFDEEVMTSRSKKPFRYKVLKDGCKELNGQEGEAMLEIAGPKLLKRLPVLDVGFVEQPDGEFGFTIGRACFWQKGDKSKKRKRRK